LGTVTRGSARMGGIFWQDDPVSNTQGTMGQDGFINFPNMGDGEPVLFKWRDRQAIHTVLEKDLVRKVNPITLGIRGGRGGNGLPEQKGGPRTDSSRIPKARGEVKSRN